MKILLNAKSRQTGTQMLLDVSLLIPSVKAFMFPLAGNHCLSFEFKENVVYTQKQYELIQSLQVLGRLSQ